MEIGKYCVYKHTAPNEKVYIGITNQNPLRRWRDGWGYRFQKHFYNAILKYGWDNMRHEILFTGLSYEEAKQKEIELIASYKSADRRYGYNSTLGGDNRIGHKHSEETKKRLAYIQRGRKYSEESKAKMSIAKKGKIADKCPLSKPVLQFDKQGNFIAEYAALIEAQRQTGIPASNIRKHIAGERKQAGGYVWKYK